jgi:hypothetical protein
MHGLPSYHVTVSSRAIQKKKLPDVVDALQAAGIRHDLWAEIMNTNGAINGIADGRLPTVKLCGFPVGRDLWGGERVVGGVLPSVNIGTNV